MNGNDTRRGIADTGVMLLTGRNKRTMRPAITAGGVIVGATAFATIAALAAGVALTRDAGDARAVSVRCAASLRPAVEPLIAAFTERTGFRVTIEYGGSGALLSGMRVSGRGDVLLAADGSYVRQGRDFGVLGESVVLASQRPVIVVAAGNPRAVRSLDDLLRDDVRFAMANPDVAAIGRTTHERLSAEGRWEALANRCKAFKPTVSDVANDVLIGAVDAGIVWDSVVLNYPRLRAVDCVPLSEAAEPIEAAIAAHSTNDPAARAFLEFLASPDGGIRCFREAGFSAPPADAQ